MALFLKGTDSNGVDTVIAVESDGSITANVAGSVDANDIAAINFEGYNIEIQTDATYTYIAHAVPGSALSAAVWRAQRITTATGSRIFAAGGAFTQVATDLTALTYAV